MDYTILIYPIVYIALIVLIAAAGLLLGKRKYNKAHPKDVKYVPPAEKESKKKDESKKTAVAGDAAAAAAAAAAPTAATAAAPSPKQEIIKGPVIIIDEEKIVEWKPPSEDKIGKLAAEHDESEKQERAQECVQERVQEQEKKQVQETFIVADERADDNARAADDKKEWTDDDLEIFEARAYSFDEDEMEEKEKVNTASTFTATEPRFTSKEYPANRDPSEDEGVQVFETNDFKEREPAPSAEPPKPSNSKYTYFDSVMERDKYESSKKERLQADDAVVYKSDKPKKNPSMQYIELDIEDGKEKSE